MDSTKYSSKKNDLHLDSNRTRETEIDSLFPMPRYFQVHFEHINERITDLQRQIDFSQNRISEVNAKLDRILRLLGCNLH
jgi:hypothetical protein